MLTARKRVHPFLTHILANHRRFISSSSLSPRKRHRASPYSSSSDSPSSTTTVAPADRCRSPATSVHLATPTLGALSPARVDLLPPRKRIRGPSAALSLDDSSKESTEVGSEEDIDSDVMANIEADITAKAEDEAESSTRGTIEIMVDRVSEPEIVADSLEPSSDGVSRENFEIRGLKRSKHWHMREIIRLRERVSMLEGSNMRLREGLAEERERAHSIGRRLSYVQEELRQIRSSRYYERIDFRRIETFAMRRLGYPIVINDAVAPQDKLQFKSQVSTHVNDEIDFRISFDESDDEDYTILFDKNSFSYKIIYVNDWKTDSENDYEKVMPAIPSPEHAFSYFDDLDFFTDFENEFPAIVYNDAQIGGQDMALPPREQRYKFIRYEGLEYLNTDIVNFKGRLARVHRREVHRVLVFDFGGLPDFMAEGLSGRMLMEHRDEAGVSVFTSKAWRRIFYIKGSLVYELILEFFSTFRLCHRLIAFTIAGRSQAPKKVTMTDLFYLRGMDVGSVNVLYLLARYLRLFAAGRKRGAHISGWQFVARLAEHFRLLTAEILGELTIIAPELPVIDMAELVRLQICDELDDTWAWVAIGPERQPVAAAGALAVAKDAPIIDERGQADPAPKQAPQQPPPPPPAHAKTMPQRMDRLEEDMHKIRRGLTGQ
ncbi:hypothetical protein Tco_1016203 [Tanacetum coccineum]|uniref:Uncharacterized protein n=1 Tax=Tanacetum coccineum TaxID=301880 RepID=A0ABQ5FN04_9ASTR